MEELFTLISSYGFPMVLSVYLLIRFETKLKDLESSIDTLILLNNSSDNRSSNKTDFIH
ncbi:YvrJ family protein [Halanaerobium hydrogeniformans]|uniref:YvrJ family protein n=1 Tax=Halanaerobium hydrogeniformans TaxID=656519 RepID=E4RME6_HALHG|nr:YvrJ family protein [Halanaerobium hydrogeniformans]ADQ14477.1 hypothetical protein Halsa_1036 [Halanaerobium hydrogeniformans]